MAVPGSQPWAFEQKLPVVRVAPGDLRRLDEGYRERLEASEQPWKGRAQ